MKNIPLSDIMALSIADRVALIEIIWDSLAAEPEFVDMSDELRQELDHRLADAEANPGVGRSWAEVEARLLGLG